MRREIEKEYARVEKLIGEPVNEQVIKASINSALASLLKQGMPKAMLERMLKSAKPIGDFGWFSKRMSFEDFNKFFGGPVRIYGIDGSRDGFSYGSSSIAEILNFSPYGCSVDAYEKMRGKPERKDEATEEIFFSGHMMEPVYRSYFKRMYGDRYEVFECDIQWESRKYKDFVGNVDGLLYDKETGQFGVLEIKHTQGRNVKTIVTVQDGEAPKHWDVQERGYMELLDLDFACLFLGWGNRPGLETNAMCRTERDTDIGESILESCEDFMTYNVRAGIKPSYKNVKDPERVKASIEEIYGPIDPKKKPLSFDKSFKKNFEELIEAQKVIDEAKKKKKAAEEEIKAAQAAYDALTLPVIEELKTAPSGEFVDTDGTHYEAKYDVRNALDPEKVMKLFPDVYSDVNKPAVDTEALKRRYPEVYKECYGPKVDGKRTFTLRTWKEKKRR